MAALKYSRQREAIKEFLDSRHDHPSADTVYENLRVVFPNISLGTVYRNLSLLADIGEITKVTVSNGPHRYDARKSPHNHFICRNCHSVIDLDIEEDSALDQKAALVFPGKIEGHITNFYGLCVNCMKKVEKEKEMP